MGTRSVKTDETTVTDLPWLAIIQTLQTTKFVPAFLFSFETFPYERPILIVTVSYVLVNKRGPGTKVPRPLLFTKT